MIYLGGPPERSAVKLLGTGYVLVDEAEGSNPSRLILMAAFKYGIEIAAK